MAGTLFCPNGHEGAGPDDSFCGACGAPLASTPARQSIAAAGLLGLTWPQSLLAMAGAIVLLGGAAGSGLVLKEEAGAGNGIVRASALQATPTQASAAVGSATATGASPQGSASPATPPPAPAATTVPPAQPTVAAAGAAPTATPRPPTATNVPPTATQPPKPNLVGNGGFETGSLSAPWGTGIYEPRREVFWGSADADAVVVSDSVHGGQYALRITNRSAQAAQIYRTLAQKVAVNGGQQYCLTWWARTANARNGIMNFRMNDAWSIVPSIAAGLPDYTHYAWTFVAEDNNIDLRIVSENTGTVWVDDIEMSEGPCTTANGVVPAGVNPRGPR